MQLDGQFLVILKYDGITRFYRCDCWFDATVLVDALQRRYSAECIEVRPCV